MASVPFGWYFWGAFANHSLHTFGQLQNSVEDEMCWPLIVSFIFSNNAYSEIPETYLNF